MRFTYMASITAAFLLALPLASSHAQVIVDGQSHGVVIGHPPTDHPQPVRRPYGSVYNHDTRARIVTRNASNSYISGASQAVHLSYTDDTRARLITRESGYADAGRNTVTVYNDTFGIDPYFARRYYEDQPYVTHRRYSSYGRYGFYAPYHGFRHHYYPSPYRRCYSYPAYSHHGHHGSNYIRYSNSGLHFRIRF